MQHTYPIIFRLLFGLIAVSMPQVYGLGTQNSLAKEEPSLIKEYYDELEIDVYSNNIGCINPEYAFELDKGILTTLISQDKKLLARFFSYMNKISTGQKGNEQESYAITSQNIYGILKKFEKEIFVQITNRILTFSLNNENTLNIDTFKSKTLQHELFKCIALSLIKGQSSSGNQALSEAELAKKLKILDKQTKDQLFLNSLGKILKNEILKAEILRTMMLRTTYNAAMQVYDREPGNPPLKNELAALYDLKGKMGKQKHYNALLVSGYVRLHLNLPDENENIYVVHEVLYFFIESYVVFARYQETAEQVVQWAVEEIRSLPNKNSGRGDFIAEWLKEGMKNQALCKSIDYLKKCDTDIKESNNYTKFDTILTAGNNFSKKRLLQSLIDEHNWPVPTEADIKNCANQPLSHINCTRAYKMRCLLSLKKKKMLLYGIQSMHILNKSIMTGSYYEKAETRTRRNLIIAENPYILRPLSYLSVAYWEHAKLVQVSMGNCNVVDDLLHMAGVIIITTTIVITLCLSFLGYGPFAAAFRDARKTYFLQCNPYVDDEIRSLDVILDDSSSFLSVKKAYRDAKQAYEDARKVYKDAIQALNSSQSYFDAVAAYHNAVDDYSAAKRSYRDKQKSLSDAQRSYRDKQKALSDTQNKAKKAEKFDLKHFHFSFWRMLGSFFVWMLYFCLVLGGSTLLWTKRNEEEGEL